MPPFGIGATAFVGRTVSLETSVAAVSHFLHSGPGAAEIAGLPLENVSPDQTVSEPFGAGVVGCRWYQIWNRSPEYSNSAVLRCIQELVAAVTLVFSCKSVDVLI